MKTALASLGWLTAACLSAGFWLLAILAFFVTWLALAALFVGGFVGLFMWAANALARGLEGML